MRLVLTLLLAVGLLAACGDDADDPADWTAVESPRGADDAGGLVWADAETGEIRLADGSTLAAGASLRSFVLAGAGAYAVSKDGAIVEVSSSETRETTAHTAGVVKASPDGRYIAFLDDRAGERYEEGTNQLVAVVVDLQRGEEVYRSTRGMGDLDEDLTSLYSEADYGVLAVGDETAWIKPPSGDVLAIDLATGDVQEVDAFDLYDPEQPWVQPRLTKGVASGDLNPAGTWGWRRFDTADGEQRDRLVSTDGEEIELTVDAAGWSLERWVDDETVAGFADLGTASDGTDRSLMTCTLPDGACELVPDSTDAILPTPRLH